MKLNIMNTVISIKKTLKYDTTLSMPQIHVS